MMKKFRVVSATLLSAILICAICVSAGAAMTGTGTEADPYKLSSQADLALLSGANYAGYVGQNVYFELANDISMSGAFTPIGTSTYKFNGKFDGRNHVITGLTTTDNTINGQALFSHATAGASIKNIVFEGASIKGKERVAVLLGTGTGASVSNPVIIDNVIVRNSIVDASGYNVGSIAGYGAEGGAIVISNCKVIKSTTKSSGDGVGSIAGVGAYNGNAQISNCLVDSCQTRSTSGGYVGSIAGYGAVDGNAFLSVTDCTARNCIVQTSGAVGSIAGVGAYYGNARAEFVRCHAENCYVQGGSHVGGIAGYGTYGAATVTCQFTDCTVEKCTVRATGNFAGGIYGSYRANGAQPIVSGCDVLDSSILASSNAGGVTGGYCAS